MKLLGSSLTKIHAEKLSAITKELKINTNVNLSNIKELKPEAFKSKDIILEVAFFYNVDYSPDFAKIDLDGKIVLSVEAKLAKDVLKQWEDKKIPEDFRLAIFNVIFQKSIIRALQLEEELNLPHHVPLFNLKKQGSQQRSESDQSL